MQSYTADIKAQAWAAHAAGESTKSLANRLGIPEATLRGWWQKATRVEIAPKNQSWLDEQVWGLIADTIEGLRSIARQASDPGWLREQNAHDLGIFAGVQSDKLVRVLAALDYEHADALAAGDHEGSTIPG